MPAAAVDAPSRMPSYFQAVTGVMRHPLRFFTDMEVSGIRAPFRVLLISAVFHTVVCFTYVYGRSVPLALALFINSLAVPFVMGGLAWMLKTMFFSRDGGFDRFFTAFAYASGATLLFSWIPSLGMFIEPWRLFIAAAGLAKGCGLGWKRGLIVLVLSLLLFLMLVWSAMPVIQAVKMHLAG